MNIPMNKYAAAAFAVSLPVLGFLTGRFAAAPVGPPEVTPTPDERRLRTEQVATLDMRPRPPDWITMCLADPDQVARRFAFKQWLAERGELADKLKRLVDDPETPASTRYYAVKLITRADLDGAAVLLKHITWPYTELPEDAINPLGGYPCAEGLSVIGLNCVPALLDSLAREAPDDATDLMVQLRATVMIKICNEAYSPADGPREAMALTERALERGSHLTSEMYFHRDNIVRLLDELREQVGPEPDTNGGTEKAANE